MACSRGTTPWLLTLALLPLTGCNVGTTDSEEATHVDRVYSGYVIDINGAPVSGAVITSSDGTLTTRSNAIGQFVLLETKDSGRAQLELTASQDGFLSNNAKIPLTDTSSHYTTLITLNPVTESQTVAVEVGGKFSFADGKLLLTFGANAWQDEAGNAVDGEVEVVAEVIEPESLRADRLPVPSMLANDPGTPGQEALLASFGMFQMEAYQDGMRVYPAEGSTFTAEITGIERFVESGALLKDSYIPAWYMDEGDTVWQYGGWWSVVPSEAESAKGQVNDDDDPVGSDNTRYSIVTDVPVGTGSGKTPPSSPRYNCDARPMLSCVHGKIDAEGLHNNEDSDNPRELTTSPVSGAWVGFAGTGQAEFCSVCECHEQKTITLCEDVVQEDGTTVEVCHEELVDNVTYPNPDNSGVTDDPCGNLNPNLNCTCSKWEVQAVSYTGSAYTNSAGEYCANVGAGGIVNTATVLKDWMITETDPKTKKQTSSVISYEYNEDPQIRPPRQTMCEDGAGACGTWNHTMPCEWFWMNGGCAVVGGCEVFHLRGYDDEQENGK